MAKISAEAKNRYFEKIKEYKGTIDSIRKNEQKILATINEKSDKVGLQKIFLAEDTLNMVSNFLLMNELSMSYLGMKNEAYLNDARKGIYKTLIYMEDVVSNYIDAPFSDYEDKLEMIAEYPVEQRWRLIRKIGFSIHSVIDGFGENTKWKWSFVELEGRFATIVKNLINMKTIVPETDPFFEGHEIRNAHLRLTKEMLLKSADGYRQKYELSTLRLDDFKLAIRYLAALRRISILLGDSDNADAVKKKIDVWKAKMEADRQKLEQKNKQRLKK